MYWSRRRDVCTASVGTKSSRLISLVSLVIARVWGTRRPLETPSVESRSRVLAARADYSALPRGREKTKFSEGTARATT